MSLPFDDLYDQGDRDDFVSNDNLKKAGFYADSLGRPKLSQNRVDQDIAKKDTEELFEYIKEKIEEVTRPERLVEVVRLSEHRLERRFPPCFLIHCSSGGEHRFYQGSWHTGGHGSHLYVSGDSVIVAHDLKQAKALHLLADRIHVLRRFEEAENALNSLSQFVYDNFEDVGARLGRLSDKRKAYLLKRKAYLFDSP